LAKEVLSKILEIEEKARDVIEQARIEAARTADGAKSKSESLETEFLAEMKKKRKEILNRAKAEADAEIKKIQKDLTQSIREIEKRAKPNLSKAKDLIAKEMKKKLCL
jgi:vacuolar-type H+-ATPase subunit H